ncbi:MAG: DUF975 family protein [Cytophagaceae bacterium]
MATNAQLKEKALESLKDKWGIAIGGTLLFGVMMAAASFIPFASLIVTGPLTLGWIYFYLKISKGEEPQIDNLFEGFKKFENALVLYILESIFIILWMLLLIVPGIIAAISYSQAYYIMAEDPNIKPMEAIDKSKAMMDGYKWKYFGLGFHFFGWFILCLLTVGIGFLWLIPYMTTTFTNFYHDVKGDFKGAVPVSPVLDGNEY